MVDADRDPARAARAAGVVQVRIVAADVDEQRRVARVPVIADAGDDHRPEPEVEGHNIMRPARVGVEVRELEACCRRNVPAHSIGQNRSGNLDVTKLHVSGPLDELHLAVRIAGKVRHSLTVRGQVCAGVCGKGGGIAGL